MSKNEKIILKKTHPKKIKNPPIVLSGWTDVNPLKKKWKKFNIS